jgi:hypothetical protein
MVAAASSPSVYWVIAPTNGKIPKKPFLIVTNGNKLESV